MYVMHRPHDRLWQCTATCPLEKRFLEECLSLEVKATASIYMHPRALHVFAFALTVIVRADCDDKAKWYSGLRSMLKNCPSEPRNSSSQDEFLETVRRCVQQRAIDTLDALLDKDVISVFEGVDLIRFRSNDENSTEYKAYFSDGLGDDTGWSVIIWNRLIRVLRTHAFKVNVDHMLNTALTTNTSKPDLTSNIVQGRRRHRRKHHHFFPMMMMGLLFMGVILVPMGFQFLAVLGGKALLLAKMALILSSIQGLKKIATSGVHYGLYHTHDGWHDRSHQVFPEEEERYPVYMPPQHP